MENDYYTEDEEGNVMLTDMGEVARSVYIARSRYGLRPIFDVPRPGVGDFWLIPGLVATTTTLVYGESKTGKSFLVANLVEALYSGREVLGQTPTSSGVRSLIITTDYQGIEEYRERLEVIGADPECALSVRAERMAEPEYWYHLAVNAEAEGIGVVVLDHAHGVIGGEDVNEHRPWYRLWNEYLGEFTRRGIAVVLVHHSSDSRFHGSKTHRPQGNSAATQYARVRVELDKPGDSPTSFKRVVKSVANNGEPLNIVCDLDPEAGRLLLREHSSTPKQQRSSETLNRNQRIATLAVQSKLTTVKDVANYVAEQIPELQAATLEKRGLKELETAGLLAPKQRSKPFTYGEKHPERASLNVG
ncbi:AAA family ATPase [Corynebacterium pseudopelargi]|uniref:Uncharacterized protein n=1 Tax=Corynebacterium pseudopelargi TaxID=2080757 RepID=A0A3G6IUK8_9CORY|nr:AAA family ATPase [Corynebacterium pseudopelargi]AZA09323.1 hypothetical protein CPPEL_06025 [Corynebacterium pseudopelargi]